MPKERKKLKTREKRYTKENIMAALNAMDNGMGLRQAASTFNVPRSTLSAKKISTVQWKVLEDPIDVWVMKWNTF